MKQATVEFRHVSKQYGPQGAVVDLSLLVPAGDICVLVGPSGCGKTTSLKMVNRLVEPTEGQVLIDGQDIMKVELTELRRGIGYVIQQVGLFPHQTIAENVGTVPRLLGWPRKRIQERTEELLDLVGLDPARVRSRYPSQLSGGERQRVGVARAMAAEPPVMLMDEPFGAVDPIVRERLQNEFLRIHHQLGTTVLFVTHDIDEAIKMGTRVAVMQQGGHLAQYAPPSELLAHPASEFVSRFVGVDRGLKRLSLMKVGDARLDAGITAHVGDSAEAGRRRAEEAEAEWLLLLDRSEAPLGWIRTSQLGADGTLSAERVDASSPLVHAETTLRDALSMLLTSAVQTAVVVDERDRFQGMLSFDEIGLAYRADPAAREEEAVAP